MKIVMMTGSAHRNGTTATLADRFQQGALDAGHEVYRFDAAFQDVHPCIGCDKCRRTGTCTFAADDMKLLNPHLLAADAVSRSIGSGSALPVGAITSLLGAPFFLTLIFGKKEGGVC